jgi:hypothetical protein
MGTLYGICTTVLGDTTRTGRNFGFKIGAEIAGGIVLLFALPGLIIEPFGFDGLVLTLTACVVVPPPASRPSASTAAGTTR